MSRPSARRAILAGVLLTSMSMSGLAGCASDREQATPSAEPTPFGRLDADSMQVPRIAFCELVPAAAVAEALGQEPESAAAYGNGEAIELPQDVRGEVPPGKDVVHELGCTWSTEAGDSARAWVFARPVDERLARTVIRAGQVGRTCRTEPAPAFGRPGSTQTCRSGDRERVRHAGLFGQTWLTCEITGFASGATDLRARVDDWCVEVTNALNTAG